MLVASAIMDTYTTQLESRYQRWVNMMCRGIRYFHFVEKELPRNTRKEAIHGGWLNNLASINYSRISCGFPQINNFGLLILFLLA